LVDERLLVTNPTGCCGSIAASYVAFQEVIETVVSNNRLRCLQGDVQNQSAREEAWQGQSRIGNIWAAYSVRDSRSRPDNGIVIFAHRGINQRNEIVMTCKRSALMLRRPKA